MPAESNGRPGDNAAEVTARSEACGNLDDAITKAVVAVEEATECDANAAQVAGKKAKEAATARKAAKLAAGRLLAAYWTLGKLLVALRESMSATKNSRNEATWRKRAIELCRNDDRPYYAVNIYEYLVAHSVGSAEQAEAKGQRCTVKSVRDAAKTWKNNLAPKTDASEERKNATSNKPQVEGNGDIDPPIQDNEGSGGGPIANASTAPHKADKTQPAAGKPRKPNIQKELDAARAEHEAASKHQAETAKLAQDHPDNGEYLEAHHAALAHTEKATHRIKTIEARMKRQANKRSVERMQNDLPEILEWAEEIMGTAAYFVRKIPATQIDRQQ